MAEETSRLTENKELVRRLNEEVLNHENYAVADELLGEEFVEYSSLPREVTNPEEFVESRKEVRSAFPDHQISIEDIIAEGDKVVVRARETGTHEGEFQGIPPTGKTVDVATMIEYRIEDGEITETWVQADMMDLMDQLGVFPPGPKTMLKMIAGKLKALLPGG